MIRRVAVASILVFSLAAQPAFADFHRVASGLRSLGFQKTWIPFLGIARSLVRVVQPKGVSDFQLAVYENTPRVTGAELGRMLQKQIGRGFTPLVRVHSARKGESVFVYARPSRNERLVELLVLTHQRDETVLVRVTADAEIVGRDLGMPRKVGAIASR